MIRITLKKNRNRVCPARILTNQLASSVHGCSLGLMQYIYIHRLLCLPPHELNQTNGNVTIRPILNCVCAPCLTWSIVKFTYRERKRTLGKHQTPIFSHKCTRSGPYFMIRRPHGRKKTTDKNRHKLMSIRHRKRRIMKRRHYYKLQSIFQERIGTSTHHFG